MKDVVEVDEVAAELSDDHDPADPVAQADQGRAEGWILVPTLVD